jgi:hypothetical protein
MNQLKEFRRKNREPGSSMAFYILFSISNSPFFFFFAGKLPYKIRELIILLSMVFIQWNGYYSNKIKDITIGKDVQTNIRWQWSHHCSKWSQKRSFLVRSQHTQILSLSIVLVKVKVLIAISIPWWWSSSFSRFLTR